MAVKQNGVLGTFTPTVTPYTNLTVNATHPNNKLATTAFNFYTCPAATLASGKIVVANNTGGAATVDIKKDAENAYAEHCREADINTQPLRDCISYYNGLIVNNCYMEGYFWQNLAYKGIFKS